MGKEYSKELLVDAILADKEDKLDKYLELNPDKVNSPLMEGNTNPICRASYLGKRNIIAVLLKHGADIDIRCGGKGNTGIMWAAWRNYTKTVEFLISEGADLKVQNFDGDNALDVSIYRMSYHTARILKAHGFVPKAAAYYKSKLPIEFDVEHFITCLEEDREVNNYKEFRIETNECVQSQIYEEEIKKGTIDMISDAPSFTNLDLLKGDDLDLDQV